MEKSFVPPAGVMEFLLDFFTKKSQGCRGQSPLARPAEGRESRGQSPLAPPAEGIKQLSYFEKNVKIMKKQIISAKDFVQFFL